MEIRFVPQPFEGESNLSDFIADATNRNFSHLRIAVAWAKLSGLGRVHDDLKEFRSRGGTVEMIVGVSEGGATLEGLKLVHELADTSYVFHHPDRTFHPKVYLARGDAGCALFVGSSNLTAGGLAWNYEASLWGEWGPDEDITVIEDVEAWLERLIAQDSSCKPLTVELIQQIQDSPDLFLGSELGARRVMAKKGADTPEDSDSIESGSAGGLFSRVVDNLRKLSPLSAALPKLKGSRIDRTSAAPLPGNKAVRPPVPSGADTLRRWYKELDHTAAQQPKSKKTNPTGNLRLSQTDSDFEHKSYFYETFFGGLPWSPTPGKETEQEVIVVFHCWIDGSDYGFQEIRISHDPRRVAEQGNVPTVLHWGPLSPILKNTNYIGHFVTLEQMKDRTFNLFISEKPRGEYLA